MPIPAFKLSTHASASKVELERRTFTPEDEAVLTVRWRVLASSVVRSGASPNGPPLAMHRQKTGPDLACGPTGKG